MIKVSIIIPAYNVEQYIQRCIESASNQTLQEIEIIVVNDGATDSTPSIIAKCAEKAPRIVVINKKNGALSSARNAGLDVVKGEYIQHLDGDNWIEKEACEVLYKYAYQHDLDMVVCDYYSDDDNGMVYKKDLQAPSVFLTAKEYLMFLFKAQSEPCIWGKFIRASIYRDLRCPENISVGEDLAITARLAVRARKIGKLNKAFVHYIFNPKSITRYQGNKKAYQFFLVMDGLEAFFKKEGFYNEFQTVMSEFKSTRILYFIVGKPYWKDEGYKKALREIVPLLRTMEISDSISRKGWVILTFLKLIPFRWALKFINGVVFTLNKNSYK